MSKFTFCHDCETCATCWSRERCFEKIPAPTLPIQMLDEDDAPLYEPMDVPTWALFAVVTLAVVGALSVPFWIGYFFNLPTP